MTVPRLFFSGNILRKKFTRREVSPDEIVDATRGLQSAMLTPADDEGLLAAAIALACDLGHPVYDCLYLALADSLDTAVVTADQKFANKVADPARVVFVAEFLKA